MHVNSFRDLEVYKLTRQLSLVPIHRIGVNLSDHCSNPVRGGMFIALDFLTFLNSIGVECLKTPINFNNLNRHG